MLTSGFTYDLPHERIAQSPAEPRDSSRLFDARTMTDHVFAELPGLLRPGDLVVVNSTKVRHARLLGRKATTGGAVEVLLLGVLADGSWDAMIRPARRIRAGVELDFGPLKGTVLADPDAGRIRLHLDGEGDIEDLIEAEGRVPLPPYITTDLTDPDRYQTVYARDPGSAAAPTAGLHFTGRTLEALAERDIAVAEVDLEVGIATFRPIATERIDDHAMHVERYRIPPETAAAVDECRARAGRVVAIGTTTVRTLETAATDQGAVIAGSGATSLYLVPGHRIRCVDLLVTNFHLPRSSLLVLLESFMGPTWREVYREAIERHYRFLSFGDAMLCERAEVHR